LKNQFRALDDDEIEFLESVQETSRAKEDAMKQETAEQLDAFRKQRAAAEQTVTGGTEITDAAKDTWTTSKKKRRREPEPGLVAKARKVANEDDSKDTKPVNAAPSATVASTNKPTKTTVATSKVDTPAPAGLNLCAYGSSDEED
jgi:hypothetical protein